MPPDRWMMTTMMTTTMMETPWQRDGGRRGERAAQRWHIGATDKCMMMEMMMMMMPPGARQRAARRGRHRDYCTSAPVATCRAGREGTEEGVRGLVQRIRWDGCVVKRE
eukprot:2955126-Pyramimonas_sp.AAC.3